MNAQTHAQHTHLYTFMPSSLGVSPFHHRESWCHFIRNRKWLHNRKGSGLSVGCPHLCMCVSGCVRRALWVCLCLCVWRGERYQEDREWSQNCCNSSIWGLGPAWNSKISLLPWRWKNLPPLSGSSGSPRGSAQKSVCGQCVFTVIRPLLQVCVHTRKSVKPPRI